MLQEVFELMMQVHEGMHIACIGLMDGTKIERQIIDDKGNKETKLTVELEKMDVGFATFRRVGKSSYSYNNVATNETSTESKIAIPYSNITYIEFTNEEE